MKRQVAENKNYFHKKKIYFRYFDFVLMILDNVDIKHCCGYVLKFKLISYLFREEYQCKCTCIFLFFFFSSSSSYQNNNESSFYKSYAHHSLWRIQQYYCTLGKRIKKYQKKKKI